MKIIDNINSKDYGLFKDIWESPERYALVKNEFREEFAIIDIVDKSYVLIEDEHLEKIVQEKLRENGCKIFNNIRDAIN